MSASTINLHQTESQDEPLTSERQQKVLLTQYTALQALTGQIGQMVPQDSRYSLREMESSESFPTQVPQVPHTVHLCLGLCGPYDHLPVSLARWEN